MRFTVDLSMAIEAESHDEAMDKFVRLLEASFQPQRATVFYLGSLNDYEGDTSTAERTFRAQVTEGA